MKVLAVVFLFFACVCGLTGCMQAHPDDDLRGVPVTNNPNILPRTGQTAQGPSYGN